MKLSVGDTAPGFTLLDQDRKVRNIGEFLGKGTVMVAFFPGAFTSTCTREMCSLRDSMAQLASRNAQVVGISVNDPWTLKGFSTVNSLTFPLLSDFNRETIASYGVELPDFGGVKGYEVAQRSVFLLDKAGRVKFIWIAPQPGIEPDYKLLDEELAKMA